MRGRRRLAAHLVLGHQRVQLLPLPPQLLVAAHTHARSHHTRARLSVTHGGRAVLHHQGYCARFVALEMFLHRLWLVLRHHGVAAGRGRELGRGGSRALILTLATRAGRRARPRAGEQVHLRRAAAPRLRMALLPGLGQSHEFIRPPPRA